jgi:ABC-2 type transport system permease protein
MLIIYLLATILSVHIIWHPLNILGVIVLLSLGAILFSTFSLIIACLVKSRERFMGIGQLMTMPLFFASNAIYPVNIMPGWLKVVSHFNPLTYMIDGIRVLMTGASSGFPLTVDFAVLVCTAIVLVLIGGKLYKQVIV